MTSQQWGNAHQASLLRKSSAITTALAHRLPNNVWLLRCLENPGLACKQNGGQDFVPLNSLTLGFHSSQVYCELTRCQALGLALDFSDGILKILEVDLTIMVPRWECRLGAGWTAHLRWQIHQKHWWSPRSHPPQLWGQHEVTLSRFLARG